MIRLLIFFVTALGSLPALGQAVGTCAEGDEALAARSSTYLCESFTSNTWYDDNGFAFGQGLMPRPIDPDDRFSRSRLVSGPVCLNGGSCLESDWQVGENGVLNITWPVLGANEADSNFEREPEDLYFRYYIKFGPTWNPDLDDGAEGNGKLAGFSDGRLGEDEELPHTGCGNGGATADGIRCWTARGLFWHCEDKHAQDSSFPVGSSCNNIPGAKARFGAYLYVNGNGGQTTGANAIGDGYGENQTFSPEFNATTCRRSGPPGTPEHIPACYSVGPNNYYAGIGAGNNVIVSDRWYAYEQHVKMNTPGVANGVLEIWIDDVLVYQKTNMLYRKVGHNNLHVRTLWLNFVKGGGGGNTDFGQSWIDQIVVSSERIGMVDGTFVRPNPPTNFSVEP